MKITIFMVATLLSDPPTCIHTSWMAQKVLKEFCIVCGILRASRGTLNRSPPMKVTDQTRPFPTSRERSEKVGKGRERSGKVGKGRERSGNLMVIYIFSFLSELVVFIHFGEIVLMYILIHR